jgi:very-short-patch-repair endonuclease
LINQKRNHGWPKTDQELSELLGTKPGTIRSRKSVLLKKNELKHGLDFESKTNPKSSKDITLWFEPGAIKIAKELRRFEKARFFLEEYGIRIVEKVKMEHHYTDIIVEAIKGFTQYKRSHQVEIKYGEIYKIDLYLPELKLAIECDELGHYSQYEYKNNDPIRQDRISNYLGCQFIRFNPEGRGFNIGEVINKVFCLIIKN